MARVSERAMVFVVVVLRLLFTSSQQADINDFCPTNLNYTELTSRSVRLSWEHPKNTNGSRTGYRVRLYRPPDERWIAVYKTGANNTNITISCLTSNTSYKFAVCIEKNDNKSEQCEKCLSNFTLQTLLDEATEEAFSFTSVIANWRAVLLGFGLALICVLILAGTIFAGCKCYSQRKKSTQSQDDSVLRVRPWDHPTNDRHYSEDPTSGKGLVNLPDLSPPVYPAPTTSSSQRLPPPPPKSPSRFNDNGDNCSEPPRVPSWPGSTCVSQNLDEIADLAVYQNEVFTSNGPADDLPVYTNEMFDGQESNDRSGRRHRRNQPVDLPVYGNYQF